MNLLPLDSTLRQLQDHVAEWEKERGFADETALQKCLLLGEELGELFKAVREATGIKSDRNSSNPSIEEELADVLIFVVAIGNRFGVDLERAFRNKEVRNNQREWR